MTEKLLQFIWAFGYFNKSALTTTEGEPLSILLPGTINKNAGPDFLNAKIRIGATTLAGTVELHLKTSDWRRHRHGGDVNYNNVILHAVLEHDESVNGIPVLELSPRISTLLLERYRFFMDTASAIPCGANIQGVKELTWKAWKERLVVERLTRKAAAVNHLFEQSNHHWEETWWWMLARAFGGNVNSEAFEAMARSVSVNLLAKHKASLHQLEAMLLGQAGLLDDDFGDEYPKLLQREYVFLKKKYSLQPAVILVQFLRMRPVSFPTIRLAQLAALLQQSTHLFSKIIEAENLDEIQQSFTVTANDFWHYHYTFKQASAYKPKTLGADTINHIVINTIAPVLFAYSQYHKSESGKEKALRWLEETAPETNSITKEFSAIGIENKTAFDSQALIELKNQYCSEKRCLECSVGNYLLREAAAEYNRTGSK